MSCPNSQNPLVLNVSAGRLPEGFCPQNLQELFDAFVARIIISPSEASLNIAGGSEEPSSNVGPWFKNCEELFVFDDETGRYKPVPKGGFDTMEYFTTSGTFIVPETVSRIRVQLWGAGGGGGGGGTTRSGGGSGGYCESIFDVVPGQAFAYTIGTGGAGTTGGVGANGGASTFSTLTAGGGSGGNGSTSRGTGGTATGGIVNMVGQYGEISVAAGESAGNGGNAPGGGGGGGTASNVAGNAGTNGAVPGGGGAGSESVAYGVGSGANGGLIIEY